MVGGAAAEQLAEHPQRLLHPLLGDRGFDRLADTGAVDRGRLGGELGLAAGEVVVDRAAGRFAALGDVAQLHPRVALLGEQPAGALEQAFAAVAALRLGGLTIGESGYAHGHSL